MDQTPNRFAYRCLPLSIANSTGWMLINPHDFIVTWIGGQHKDTLTVHIDSGDHFNWADSTFGDGILTFHPGYLFKTEPGWNMLVTGPMNWPIDFMSPLSGIVETNWLNFTFTMNWQLTKKGSFTIPAGMPICQLIPVPDYGQIEIDATMKDLADADEYALQYNKWANDRLKTIDNLDKAFKEMKPVGGIDPTKPETQWEKNYMKGIDKDGKKHDNHVTSIKFPKFKEH